MFIMGGGGPPLFMFMFEFPFMFIPIPAFIFLIPPPAGPGGKKPGLAHALSFVSSFK